MGRINIFISFAICMSSIWQMCDASCNGRVPCTDNSPCRDDQACLPPREGTQNICRLCNCKEKGQCRTDTISRNVTCDCGNSGWDGPFCTCEKCRSSCPSGYTQFDRTCTCYAGFSDIVDWSTARGRCQHMNASLVKITSDAENAFVADLMTSLGGVAVPFFWLGGSDIANEGTWTWDVDSTQIGPVYSNWDTEIATNDLNGGKNCMEMSVIFDHYRNGFWNDEACYYSNKYICEYYP